MANLYPSTGLPATGRAGVRRGPPVRAGGSVETQPGGARRTWGDLTKRQRRVRCPSAGHAARAPSAAACTHGHVGGRGRGAQEPAGPQRAGPGLDARAGARRRRPVARPPPGWSPSLNHVSIEGDNK